MVALLTIWMHLPFGYHGSSGTVVVSGTDIVRPCGQRKPPTEPAPAPRPPIRLCSSTTATSPNRWNTSRSSSSCHVDWPRKASAKLQTGGASNHPPYMSFPSEVAEKMQTEKAWDD